MLTFWRGIVGVLQCYGPQYTDHSLVIFCPYFKANILLICLILLRREALELKAAYHCYSVMDYIVLNGHQSVMYIHAQSRAHTQLFLPTRVY